MLAVLGVADEQLLSDAFDAVQSGDARAALHRGGALCRGRSRRRLRSHATSRRRARELLVVQTLGEVPAELSLTPEIDERLREQAQRIGRAEVVRMLDLLGAALEGMRAGADPRTQLELALVKAATPRWTAPHCALLARIERLEQSFGRRLQPVRRRSRKPPPSPASPVPPTASSVPARQACRRKPVPGLQSAPAPGPPSAPMPSLRVGRRHESVL